MGKHNTKEADINQPLNKINDSGQLLNQIHNLDSISDDSNEEYTSTLKNNSVRSYPETMNKSDTVCLEENRDVNSNKKKKKNRKNRKKRKEKQPIIENHCQEEHKKQEKEITNETENFQGEICRKKYDEKNVEVLNIDESDKMGVKETIKVEVESEKKSKISSEDDSRKTKRIIEERKESLSEKDLVKSSKITESGILGSKRRNSKEAESSNPGPDFIENEKVQKEADEKEALRNKEAKKLARSKSKQQKKLENDLTILKEYANRLEKHQKKLGNLQAKVKKLEKKTKSQLENFIEIDKVNEDNELEDAKERKLWRENVLQAISILSKLAKMVEEKVTRIVERRNERRKLSLEQKERIINKFRSKQEKISRKYESRAKKIQIILKEYDKQQEETLKLILDPESHASSGLFQVPTINLRELSNPKSDLSEYFQQYMDGYNEILSKHDKIILELRAQPSPTIGESNSCSDTLNSKNENKTITRSTGLPNLGYTCYMNSVLQVFSHLKCFPHREYEHKINKSLSEVIKVIRGSFRERDIISAIKNFHEEINKEGENFPSNTQCDPKFLLIFLQKFLFKENPDFNLYRLSKEIIFKHSISKNKPHVSKFPETVQCILVLNPKPEFITKTDFVATFKDFVDDKPKSSKAFCNDCRKDVDGTQSVCIKSLPECLVFSISQGRYSCNLSEVEEITDDKYRLSLCAIIMRDGFQNDSGHNYAICKEQDSWVVYNDKNVNNLKKNRIEGVYLFIYYVSKI